MVRVFEQTTRIVRSEIERMRGEDRDTEAEAATLFPALRQRSALPTGFRQQPDGFAHAYNAVVFSVRLQQVQKFVIPFFVKHMGPEAVVAMQSLVDGLRDDIADCVLQWSGERREDTAEEVPLSKSTEGRGRGRARAEAGGAGGGSADRHGKQVYSNRKAVPFVL